MGTQPPSPKRGRSPQFSAHVYCGKTVVWIKMALGMEVGLGPGHIVLDGSQLPRKGHSSPHRPLFSAHVYCGNGRPSQLLLSSCYCRQTAGWIKMPLGMEVGLISGDFVLDGNPASPPLKGHSPPNFRPMSVVAKRLDGLRWHLVWR